MQRCVKVFCGSFGLFEEVFRFTTLPAALGSESATRLSDSPNYDGLRPGLRDSPTHRDIPTHASLRSMSGWAGTWWAVRAVVGRSRQRRGVVPGVGRTWQNGPVLGVLAGVWPGGPV